MKTVWVVVFEYYEDYTLHGVFTSRRRAETALKRAQKLNSRYEDCISIKEITLNRFTP